MGGLILYQNYLQLSLLPLYQLLLLLLLLSLLLLLLLLFLLSILGVIPKGLLTQFFAAFGAGTYSPVCLSISPYIYLHYVCLCIVPGRVKQSLSSHSSNIDNDVDDDDDVSVFNCFSFRVLHGHDCCSLRHGMMMMMIQQLTCLLMNMPKDLIDKITSSSPQ